MDCIPAGSSVHGIAQQEYWSGLPLLSLGNLSDPAVEPISPVSPALTGGILYCSATRDAQ